MPPLAGGKSPVGKISVRFRARPDGATPEGVLDLAGNVAEWTLERDGSFAAHGGSFRSALAADLKAWAVEARQTRAGHVGFRCAYAADSNTK